MSRPRKVDTTRVQKDIQAILRSFPVEHVTVKRIVRTFTPLKSAVLDFDAGQTVYQGEALRDPGDGVLFRFNLGEIKMENGIKFLVNGRRDIRPGDFVRLSGKLHEVKDALNWWGVWMLINCQQYGL